MVKNLILLRYRFSDGLRYSTRSDLKKILTSGGMPSARAGQEQTHTACVFARN